MLTKYVDRTRGKKGWGATRCAFLTTAIVGLAAAAVAGEAGKAADNHVFERDITRDLNLASGEPQIVVNPKNPNQLAIIEYLYGSNAVPAYSMAQWTDEFWTQWEVKDLQWSLPAHHDISNDGGSTWIQGEKPGPVYLVKDHHRYYGGGDPMIGAGPDGTLYLATEVQPPKPVVPGESNEVTDENTGRHVLVYSTDWGKSWSQPVSSNQPIDRPWLKVDQTTGQVYVASSGWYDPATETHNHPNVGILDRWLVRWEPHLENRSKPVRIGGPEPSLMALHDADLAASYGVVAASYVVGGTGRPDTDTSDSGLKIDAANATPRSLKHILPPGKECVQGKIPACFIFQTSTDGGVEWSRHLVPTPSGFDPKGFGGGTNLAADPGRAGRYAVGEYVGGQLMTLVTADSGKNWSKPATVPETAKGWDFKTRLAYSPNGVLVYLWKKARTDLNPSPLPPHIETAFDVYAAISCDGGLSWAVPIRVNAQPSLAGTDNEDDLTWVDADRHFAHLAWGDRRSINEVKQIVGDFKGQVGQAFYGRVPFSLVHHGQVCGRSSAAATAQRPCCVR